ncbi:Major facilitator superfamily domain general substrate transporter [Penicillium cosmopolitanum]|uniref:Major facilitator superfamily domain general substrate transporter n=1 Tax=Penicillium cosmopolitanum TaxID=1131564 RepID=A0A9W9WBM0_9EURO|nr:Major facilitator superfamily domain general substrate transporter [Penicillium cosmopolitanum]KAJ5414267.1 Major facilitator superfamily domain general substrate transporter [Penicillium cosmopolitanum]
MGDVSPNVSPILAPIEPSAQNNSGDQPTVAYSQAQIREATQREHDMSISTAFRLYSKAVSWSIVLSTAVIMEGYDLLLIFSFFAFEPWTKKYGKLQPDGTYALSAAWQSGLNNGASVGEIIGLLLNGFVAERFGYRKTMIGALFLTILFIFIPFFAPNIEVLQVGLILMGIPGILPVSYASEVCPVALRGHLTAYINLCWVIGQLISSGVLRSLLHRTDQWSYRIPYALQWMWPVPLIVAIAFAPESPWWYIRRGDKKGAKSALRSLTARKTDDAVDLDAAVEVMVYTNQLEQKVVKGASYIDCFKGHNLRRTEICCFTSITSIISGTTLMGNSTYFFEQAGMDPSNAFDLTMAQYAVGIVGIVFAWLIMARFGRRQQYLSGLFLQFIFLIGIGITGVVDRGNKNMSWATGALLIAFSLVYQSSVGPLCYSIISEMSSVRLRAKTTSLAWNVYNIFKIINGVLTPYMINPTAWNWQAKAGFFWGGLCLLSFVWAFFRLPETRYRTYAELDILFERKVGARKFAITSVDLFSQKIDEASQEELRGAGGKSNAASHVLQSDMRGEDGLVRIAESVK